MRSYGREDNGMEDYAGRTDEELIAELRDNRDEIIDYLLE